MMDEDDLEFGERVMVSLYLENRGGYSPYVNILHRCLLAEMAGLTEAARRIGLVRVAWAIPGGETVGYDDRVRT